MILHIGSADHPAPLEDSDPDESEDIFSGLRVPAPPVGRVLTTSGSTGRCKSSCFSVDSGSDGDEGAGAAVPSRLVTTISA